MIFLLVMPKYYGKKNFSFRVKSNRHRKKERERERANFASTETAWTKTVASFASTEAAWTNINHFIWITLQGLGLVQA